MLYSIGYIALFISIIVDIYKGIGEIWSILIDKQELYSKIIMSLFIVMIWFFNTSLRLLIFTYTLEKYIKNI